MARRALRKIKGEFDLAPWLLTFDRLPHPWNVAELFGREGPIEIEVGSGKGLFLRAAAAEHPQTLFLGAEIAAKYAAYTAAGLAKRDLQNAKVLDGDGLRVFAELLPENSIDAVHVYFPDPWWKARHRKRRVMRDSFLLDCQRTLKPGGFLHFWTDVQEYFETTLELIARITQLEGPMPVEEKLPLHDLDYRTHFERRMRQSGKPVHRSAFRKKEVV